MIEVWISERTEEALEIPTLPLDMCRLRKEVVRGQTLGLWTMSLETAQELLEIMGEKSKALAQEGEVEQARAIQLSAESLVLVLH